MEQTPKEMLKAYVDSQKFNSTTEIMDAIKEMWRTLKGDCLKYNLLSAFHSSKSYNRLSAGVVDRFSNIE